MARKNATATVNRPPHFQNEAEEADWLASPAGRRFLEAKSAAARKRGTIVIEGRSDAEFKRGLELSKSTGKAVRFVNGLDVTPTDPATIQELVDRVKAKKAEMKMIALRLPVADIDAAKRLASKTGVGYQVLLKEIIHDALGRAS